LCVLAVLGGWLASPGAAQTNKSAPPEAAQQEGTKSNRKKLEQQAKAIQAEAARLLQRHELESALREAQRALAIRQGLYAEKEYPDGTPALAMSLLTVGNSLQELGQYAKAKEHFERALRIYQHAYPAAKYPQGHLAVAVSLNNMGHVLYLEGNHQLSTTYLEQAVAMFQQLYPKGHVATVTSLNNLTDTLNAQGDYRRAAKCYLQALNMQERLDPNEKSLKERSKTAGKLYALGTALRQQADYETAAVCYAHALAIRRRLYPRDSYPQGHQDIALSLLGMANVCRQQGRYDEAREYGVEALNMYRQLNAEAKQPSICMAIALNNLGEISRATADYKRARDYFAQALEIFQGRYPQEKYPQGHITLATGLNNIAATAEDEGNYEQARQYYVKALAMYDRRYPADKYPQGHYLLARGLNNLATVLERQGAYDRARGYFERSLAMLRQIYPKVKFPVGHPELTVSLSNLATLFQATGEHAQAKDYLVQVLAMRQELYPKTKYPKGHPELATALAKLGSVLQSQGDEKEAQAYLDQALAMRRQLYREAKFPLGHRELAESLLANGLVQEALAMYQRLYHPEEYPRGHPSLAISYLCIGNRLSDQGKCLQAKEYYDQALAMCHRLYPKESYPLGHGELALGLDRLGQCLLRQGNFSGAAEMLHQATAMENELSVAFLAYASEAEALNFTAAHLQPPSALLSAYLCGKQPEANPYAYVWARRGLVLRATAMRQKAAHESTAKGMGDLYAQYLGTRRALARALLAPAAATADGATAARLRAERLGDRKEQLERQLAAALPEFARRLRLEHRPCTDLIDNLSADTAFVDLLHYVRYEFDPKVPGKAGQHLTNSYAAFVLCKGQSAARVELGAVQPINRAIETWRGDLDSSSAPEELRHLVWEPIEKRLPSSVKTIYLCPDDALTRLPWTALPGRKPGTVLLEDYALAVVPSGLSLLDQLTASSTTQMGHGLFLAVGDVRYDAQPAACAAGEALAATTIRGAVRGNKRLSWPPLAGTAKELSALKEAAGTREFLQLGGTEASTSRILAELPRARWAHLATHGFFADPQFRSIMHVDATQFDRGLSPFGERRTMGGRNPLVLSGLVLAGANLPQTEDKWGVPQGDGGILTAEAIAALPLDDLELVVLSACETGLGDVAGGEGVFGLQRAFHTAGARNVIASLWKVDDLATAALMRLFYTKLWKEGKPPIVALREAQLTLHHDPSLAARLSETRGPDVAHPRPLPPDEGGKPRSKTSHTAVRDWAGFVLSGIGR
jgi:CHAT domain-containing protein/tetratricopeptide (TPR) repeat protein